MPEPKEKPDLYGKEWLDLAIEIIGHVPDTFDAQPMLKGTVRGVLSEPFHVDRAVKLMGTLAIIAAYRGDGLMLRFGNRGISCWRGEIEEVWDLEEVGKGNEDEITEPTPIGNRN